jgi:pectate lyase C
VIGASGADGIHLYGDVTLENIHWLDIGEDAMTVKESGTVYLNCGSSAQGEDKERRHHLRGERHHRSL